jgi:NADH-quinone oxidoreductase subunit E
VRQPLPDGSTVAPEPKGEALGVTPAYGVAGPDAKGAAIAAAPLMPEVVPPLLQAPRGGQGDDLRRIGGIGPRLEQALHELGVWHYDQIASWSPGEIAWMNSRLGTFRGRIERDNWISQARRLAEEGGSWNSAKTPAP